MIDRFKAAIVAIVNELIPERRFLPPAEYRITKAEGGLFSANPVDSDLPQIVDAPIRIIGNKSKLSTGTSVIVLFLRDQKPFLIGLDETHQPDELALEAKTKAKLDAPLIEINGGQQPVARVGDLVAGVFPITSGNPTVKA